MVTTYKATRRHNPENRLNSVKFFLTRKQLIQFIYIYNWLSCQQSGNYMQAGPKVGMQYTYFWPNLCIYIYIYIYIVAGLLARSLYPEGPATGHLGTGFCWFSCVYKRMQRWFPRLQVAIACFSCSPPDLNLLDPYFIFMLFLFHISVHA